MEGNSWMMNGLLLLQLFVSLPSRRNQTCQNKFPQFTFHTALLPKNNLTIASNIPINLDASACCCCSVALVLTKISTVGTSSLDGDCSRSWRSDWCTTQLKVIIFQSQENIFPQKKYMYVCIYIYLFNNYHNGCTNSRELYGRKTATCFKENIIFSLVIADLSSAW